MNKVARVLRILEYVGDPEWVAEKINRREIKGRRIFSSSPVASDYVGQISEAIIGEIPEILEYSAIEADAQRVTERLICPVCWGGREFDPKNCTACAGLGYRDGSGPWPESVRQQAEFSQDLVSGAAEYRVEQLRESAEAKERLAVLDLAKEILVAREGE